MSGGSAKISDRKPTGVSFSNQIPEQVARDMIDAQLRAAGCSVQDKETLNFQEGQGQSHAHREDPDCASFDAQNWLGKMHQLFCEQLDLIVANLNKNFGG